MPARRFPGAARLPLTAAALVAFATALAAPPLSAPLAAQTLTGTVYDSTQAAPLAGARVVVSGTDRTAVTDAEGRFRLAGLEPGDYVVGFFHAQLDSLGVAPRGVPVRVPAEGAVRVALAVPSAATIEAATGPQRVRIDIRAPAVVVGQVLDAATDSPVRGAAVRLAGTGLEAITDTLGWFAFPEVPGGDYRLEVEHVAYGTQGDSLTVPGERTVEVVFRASAEAIALEPLDVTVLTEAERRRRAFGFAGSMYITADDIEEYFQRGARHVGDVLRLHGGNAVRVRPAGLGMVCVEYGRRRPTLPGANSGRCRMVGVVLDGLVVYRPGTDPGAAVLHDLPLDAIETIEFLPPAEATTRYGPGVGVAGAVVITSVAGSADRTRASGQEVAAEMREELELSANSPRWKHWLVGGALGAGGGVGYAVAESSFFARCEAGRCPDRRPAEIVSSALIGAAVGWLAGEIAYRIRR